MFQKQIAWLKANLSKSYPFILAGLIIVVISVKTCSPKPKPVIVNTEAQLWKDKYNNAHAKVQLLEADKKTMNARVDSIARVLDLKNKQIQSYAGATVRVDTVIKPEYREYLRVDTVKLTDTTYRLDTTKVYGINFRDSSFLSIKGEVPSKTGLQVSLGAKFTFTEYWKRKWFLGKKTYYLDVATNNPYIKIDDAFVIKREERSKLSLRPGVGVGLTYNPYTQRVMPGIQAGVYLFLTK